MPLRGEIWFSRMPGESPEKGRRPVVVVSVDSRNQNPRADTVLVVPLSTTPKRMPFHIELPVGETGLDEPSIVKPEGISSLPKAWLVAPRTPLRRITEARLREIAAGVQGAMGFSA